MVSLRGSAMCVSLFFLLACASLQAQTRTIKSSKTSKTELRPQHITLRLAQHYTFQSRHIKFKSDKINDQSVGLDIPGGALYAGYLHDTNGKYPGTPWDYESRNEFYRGALRFHSTKLLHRQIVKATLNLRIFKTHVRGVHSANDHYTQATSCGTKVESGGSEWWTSTPGQVDVANPSVRIDPSGTSRLHIDVTPIVAQWSKPQSNMGMVLVGDNEDLNAYTETICQTQYVHSGQGAPTLTVYYK